MLTFANSAFATLVVTFIFSAYFAQKIASDPSRGTILWSRAINISAFLAAVSTPLLGAIADARGRKKWFLLLTTLLCVLFTALLFFVGPGQTVRGAICQRPAGGVTSPWFSGYSRAPKQKSEAASLTATKIRSMLSSARSVVPAS